jgi:hypothetical protein
MLANHEPDWNIDDLSDSEVYAAIRNLERDPGSTNQQDDDILTILQVNMMALIFTPLCDGTCRARSVGGGMLLVRPIL